MSMLRNKYLAMMLVFVLAVSNALALQPLTVSAEGETTVYIDPSSEVADVRDGSIEKPFASWTDVTFTGYTIYLQKRGTTCVVDRELFPVSNMVMGAYGEGSKPVIDSTIVHSDAAGAQAYVIKANNVQNTTIRDLEITASKATSGIYLFGTQSSNVTVDNCIVRDSIWGIRLVGPFSGARILNTEICNIGDDGIFVKDVDNLEIGYCNIHDINQEYFTNGKSESQSPGDNIQIQTGCDHFYVHHNILDHSATGNKFALILGGDGDDTGIVEYNHLIGQGTDNFATIYLSPTVKNVIIRNNVIENSFYGLFNDLSDGVKFYNNIVNNTTLGMSFKSGLTGEVYNNTFYNVRSILQHASISPTKAPFVFKNNISVLLKLTDKFLTLDSFTNVVNFQSDYNLVYPEKTAFIKAKTNTYNDLVSWNAASGNDSHSIAADPKFTDVVNGDFTLQGGSPAIGTGTGPADMGADAEAILNTYIGVNGAAKMTVKYLDVPGVQTPVTQEDVLTSKMSFTDGTYYLGTGPKETYIMEYDVTPLFNNIDGVMGFTDDITLITGFTSLPIAVVMNTSGKFMARNGGGFAAINDVSYAANNTYHIKVVADLETKTYDVFVDTVQIADDFAFRTGVVPPINIGQICVRSGVDGQYTIKNFIVSLTPMGLKGDYYDKKDFSRLMVTRIDAAVDFDWDKGSPDPSINKNAFSVRWTGKVRSAYGEEYTFYADTDDGVRLWVDGQLLIDKWMNEPRPEQSAMITLSAGRYYDIVMEYFANGGEAYAKLSWSSQSQEKEIIPQERLHAQGTASIQ